VYQIRRARKDFAVCIIFVSVLVLRPRNPKVLTKSKIEDEEENDEGASAHCSRSADLQSAVSRICNPRGVNSSTTTGRLGRCRIANRRYSRFQNLRYGGGGGMRPNDEERCGISCVQRVLPAIYAPVQDLLEKKLSPPPKRV